MIEDDDAVNTERTTKENKLECKWDIDVFKKSKVCAFKFQLKNLRRISPCIPCGGSERCCKTGTYFEISLEEGIAHSKKMGLDLEYNSLLKGIEAYHALNENY